MYAKEAKLVTSIVKNSYITVWFLQEQLDNGIFVQKHEKYSIMPADMCTKPCFGTIIIQNTKGINGLCFYSSSDTKHHQLMNLNESGVT